MIPILANKLSLLAADKEHQEDLLKTMALFSDEELSRSGRSVTNQLLLSVKATNQPSFQNEAAAAAQAIGLLTRLREPSGLLSIARNTMNALCGAGGKLFLLF